MEFECNSLASCSYSALELIADQSIYFAAKNVMDPHARNGPGLPLAVALISKIGSLSLYYGKKLQDHFVHPMPSMSYSGVKGVFGAYIGDYLHKYHLISSRASMAVTIAVANILNIAEHYLLDNGHESTESNFFCDYSWKKESEIIYPNATTIAFNTPSSAAFDLFLADTPNIALRFGTLFFVTKLISKKTFSQIFAGSVLSLLVHASVLKFGDQDSTFIRNCKILNGRPHIPVVMGMLLKLPVDMYARYDNQYRDLVIPMLTQLFLISFYGVQNSYIYDPGNSSYIDSLNTLRGSLRMVGLEGACIG